MANPFLNGTKPEDLETAILLDRATVTDIGKAVAFTNEKGDVFINTDDNLYKILPDYNEDMLKWLLWHEKTHGLLSHANRFFKYLRDLDEKKLLDEFYVTKEEVNIIMDILVHDWMEDKFPDLVPTAKKNLAQFRNHNSLKYTFKTYTLEEMIDEYKNYKEKPDEEKAKRGTKSGSSGEKSEKDDDGMGTPKETDDVKMRKDESKTGRKGHGKGGNSTSSGKKEDTTEIEVGKTLDESSNPGMTAEHDDTDWSKLKEIDTHEFIDDSTTERIQSAIQKLKRKKLKLAKLTETLNGLASNKRRRSYKMPSMIQTSQDIILKGRTPGFAKLYLCFDASGSMGYELETFKKIISETIPQAMDCPCEWFSGYDDKTHEQTAKLKYNKSYRDCTYKDYYKGKFKDIMNVEASSGYGDDGDRVIDLCLLAEEKGYTPIGITDGGGGICYPDKLRKLKRTVLIGTNKYWLDKAKLINPNIQTQDI